MDFQPPNRHVRDSGLAAVVEEERDLIGPRFWVTFWHHYTPEEALRALALPGDLPTHQIAFELPAGQITHGPTWVAPIPIKDPERAQPLPKAHLWRSGGGVELFVPDHVPLPERRGSIRTWDPESGAWEVERTLGDHSLPSEHDRTYADFEGQASGEEGGGGVLAPAYEDWRRAFAYLSERDDEPNPELYKRTREAAVAVAKLPDHLDRDRPESVARLVARWVWPQGPMPDDSLALSGAAFATAVLETTGGGPATQDDRVLAAQLDATLARVFEEKIEKGSEVANRIDKKIEQFGFPVRGPYDDAWRLLYRWLEGADGLIRIGSSGFEAWLAQNPGFPSERASSS